VVVTVKDPAVPTTKLVELALVMDGDWVAEFTCQLNMTLALAPFESVAVTVTEAGPPRAMGVPDMSPFELMLSPAGRPVAI
jgi:hypothetical protein